jgi:hypothetical protein
MSLARHSADKSMRRRVGIQASQAVTFSCKLPELSCPHILLEYWLHSLPALIEKKISNYFTKGEASSKPI